MPGLAGYEIIRERVTLPKRPTETEAPFFEVRGLGLPDIEHLVSYHLGDLVKAVDLYIQKKNGRMAASSLQEFALIIARDVPALVTEIIYIATDEEGAEILAKVKRLPVLVQINALLQISKLTSEEAGGLKNLIAFAAPLLDGVLAGAESEPGTLKRKLLTSIGAFAKMAASSEPTE